MKNVINPKFIYEVFNIDTFVCNVIATSLNDAIKIAQKKVSFNPIVIDTGHQLN